jgi:hypothetical protein
VGFLWDGTLFWNFGGILEKLRIKPRLPDLRVPARTSLTPIREISRLDLQFSSRRIPQLWDFCGMPFGARSDEFMMDGRPSRREDR